MVIPTYDRNAILTVYIYIYIYIYPFRIKDSYGRQEFLNLPFLADNLSKKDQSRLINFIDQLKLVYASTIHREKELSHFDLKS